MRSLDALYIVLIVTRYSICSNLVAQFYQQYRVIISTLIVYKLINIYSQYKYVVSICLLIHIKSTS